MSNLLFLFLTFLKIGAVSFGGGYGMISVLQDEVVNNGWLTEKQMLDFIAVSESTPGPIAVNMATFVGYSQGGFWGALLATLGVVLPAFLIIIIVVSVIAGLMKFAGVKAALSGIRPVVIGLIAVTGLLTLCEVLFGLKSINGTFSFDWRALVILCIIALVCFIPKIVRKKTVSPILLIIISALLGMFFYGVLG